MNDIVAHENEDQGLEYEDLKSSFSDSTLDIEGSTPEASITPL